MKYLTSLFLVFLCVFNKNALSQFSVEGKPIGLIEGKNLKLKSFYYPPLNIDSLVKNSYANYNNGFALEMGVCVKANITPDIIDFVEINNGKWLWQAIINAEKAKGIGLYFSKFQLQNDDQLFVYSLNNKTNKTVLGAFTALNNQPDNHFAIDVIESENIVIELVTSNKPLYSTFEISDILYAFLPNKNDNKNFKSSGECQVNVACSEGNNWTKEKNGIVKIKAKVNNKVYLCSGSLVNNTSNNLKSLLLTANHCRYDNFNNVSSEDDLSQWVFTFLYESADCNVNEGNDNLSLVGAKLLASPSNKSQDIVGSDFLLLELHEKKIPSNYKPYYNGWENADIGSNSGVCIHHPNGDIKKISTYKEPLQTVIWFGNKPVFYKIRWCKTTNGHGVTEGGSSGAPIFDNDGCIVGQLAGGASGCENLNDFDFFGKLSESWGTQNSDSANCLRYWLDPINSGKNKLNGTFNESYCIANFIADTNTLPIGSSLNFYDKSKGNPNKWKWTFDGADEKNSTYQNPINIKYSKIGHYNVQLEVENEFGKDIIVKKKMIKVIPFIFPNPSNGKVKLFVGKNIEKKYNILIFNTIGKCVFSEEIKNIENDTIDMDISFLQNGFYIIKFISNNSTVECKFLISK